MTVKSYPDFATVTASGKLLEELWRFLEGFHRQFVVRVRLLHRDDVPHINSQLKMGTRESFRLKLNEIASKLKAENLERLKYLCQDLVPLGDLEKIKTPEQLFLELEQRKEITPNRTEFLSNRLEKIGRQDLADDLKDYQRIKLAEGK